MEVSLPALAPGSYKVIWRIVALDGHKAKGEYSITVKCWRRIVAAALSAAVATLGLIMLAAAVGTAAASAWLLPASTAADIQPLLGQLRLALWRLFGFSLLVVTVANCVELLLRTVSFSELPLGEAFPEIGTVLLKTHYGGLWLARSAMILTSWIAWALQRRMLPARALPCVMLCLLSVIAVTLCAAGHAGDDGLLTLVNLANSLHIVGAFLWAGGILATALIILPRLRRSAEASTRTLVADVSLRLSSLAALALALFAVAALLSQQTPAVHAEHDGMAPQQHEHQHGAD